MVIITVRGDDDCQPQGGREPGSNGRVNTSEPLLNVVNRNKPKRLIRLGPKGTWPGSGVGLSPLTDMSATGE